MLVILTMFGSSVLAEEENSKSTIPEPLRLIPSLQLNDHLALKMWGWSSIKDSWASDGKLGKYQTSARFNANLDGTKLGLGLVADLTYAEDGEIDGNYLRELYLKVKLTDHLSAQLGDILLPVGRGGGSIPGPFAWKTIGYPYGIPYTSYASGLKTNWENERWLFSGALTGNSGELFDSAHRFDRLELSGLAKRKWKNGAIGVLGQVSEDFARGGIFAECNWDNGWFGRCEWDHSWMTAKTSDQNGFYALLGKALTDNVEASILVQSNQLFSKSWTEMVKTKGKDGKISWKQQIKHSPAKCDSGVGLNLRIHTKDELLAWKTQLSFPFGEDNSGQPIKSQLATEIQVRF